MDILISRVFFLFQGNGVAIATKVGKVLIVVFVWKHVAMTDMTMIKVNNKEIFYADFWTRKKVDLRGFFHE